MWTDLHIDKMQMWIIYTMFLANTALIAGAGTSNKVLTILSERLYSWNQAWEICESLGGHLLTVDSEDVAWALDYFIKRQWSAQWDHGITAYWSGLHSASDALPMTYVWSDCSPLGGYPPEVDTSGSGRCVAVEHDPRIEAIHWSRISCASSDRVICEQITGKCSFLAYNEKTFGPSSENILMTLVSSSGECRRRCLEYAGNPECWGVTYEDASLDQWCTLHTAASFVELESRIQTDNTTESTRILYLKFCFEADINDTLFPLNYNDNAADSEPWKGCSNDLSETTDVQDVTGSPQASEISSEDTITGHSTADYTDGIVVTEPDTDVTTENGTETLLYSSFAMTTTTTTTPETSFMAADSLELVTDSITDVVTDDVFDWSYSVPADSTRQGTVPPDGADGNSPNTVSLELSPTMASDVSFVTSYMQTSTVEDTVMLCGCCETRPATVLVNHSVFIDEILEELSIDRKNVSSYQRKFISAPDHRKSAVAMGYVGIVMICVTFGAIFISDSITILKDIQSLANNRVNGKV